MSDIPNVKYSCCEYCGAWFLNGEAHKCAPGAECNNGTRYIEVRPVTQPDYALFAALLERIAKALEILVEKK